VFFQVGVRFILPVLPMYPMTNIQYLVHAKDDFGREGYGDEVGLVIVAGFGAVR